MPSALLYLSRARQLKVQRPTSQGQPMGECAPLGATDSPISEVGRVPVARGTYSARDEGGGPGELSDITTE